MSTWLIPHLAKIRETTVNPTNRHRSSSHFSVVFLTKIYGIAPYPLQLSYRYATVLICYHWWWSLCSKSRNHPPLLRRPMRLQTWYRNAGAQRKASLSQCTHKTVQFVAVSESSPAESSAALQLPTGKIITGKSDRHPSMTAQLPTNCIKE